MGASPHPTILLCGDVTDSWVNGLDNVFKQAATTPWLQAFLVDLFAAFKREVRGMDTFLRDNFGPFSSFEELAQRYRRPGDPVGMVHALLLYVMRGSILLTTAYREPLILSPGEGSPETHLIGISGGLWNAVSMPTSSNFSTLYDTCIETGKIYARLCGLTFSRSRAMEDSSEVWGYIVIDVAADELDEILKRFQQTIGIPHSKRVKVAVTGDRWSTIIGPPSVLELVVNQCPDLKKFPRNEMAGIRAMQHTLEVSDADIDFVVGDSPLLNNPLWPGYKIWGMADNDAGVTYDSWGELLRVAALQTLSQRLDISQAVGKLSAHLGMSQNVNIKMIGPSGHGVYLANALQAGPGALTRQVAVEDDLSAQAPSDKLRQGDAIAIVGMSGKGPGSEDLEEFWNTIVTGKDCHEEIPADRFNLDEYYCVKHGAGGASKCTITCRHGCFIKNPGHFDAKFFHISPREALLMDPNHRLFLMSAYEALETAGYSAGKSRTTDPNKIGVFFSQSAEDWHKVCHRALGCDAYTMQCIQRAFGPGRLAFQMKWEGPTYALDSACAGATSCIHLACMSLLSRDIDMAVAGAANVLSDPHSFSILSKAGVLSDTSNCKTYRDDADGYCRGEFSGAIVLKRLDDAVAHNDNILAVIASSARNHSGNSTSITTSDPHAQQRLFDKVLRKGQLLPNDVSYVEMHGTGTQVGDKAEMAAVSKVFSGTRPKSLPLVVGAVKANLGHSESAAGMPSVLKSVMMLQKGVAPPQAGFPHGMNPNVQMHLEGSSSIMIPTEAVELRGAAGKPKRILVNNFDAAGGNACVILEEHKRDPEKQRQIDPRSAHVITASARTLTSWLAGLKRLAKWLKANPDAPLQDIAYSTTARRMHHPIRLGLSASSSQEAISKLEGEIERAGSAAPKPSSDSVIFVFTGQGSHYAGMGAELYQTSPIFRETVNLCAALCRANGFPPFLDIITDTAIDMSSKNAAQIQLAVVALELALTAFWKSVGLAPAAVMGHSLGEYAALYAAGVLSLNDTLYLVGHRARLLLERCEPNSCAMLSVAAPASLVREHLAQLKDTLCDVACMNSPNATVISGTLEDLEQIQANMVAQDSKTRTTTLSVPFAFHSFQMDAILDDYKVLASGVTYSPPKIPVASTLLASLVDGPGVFGEDYLVMQTRKAVDFCGGLNAISKAGIKDSVWLEIGPGPVCTSFVRSTLSPAPARVNHSIDSKSSNWSSISKALANMYSSGIDVDWLSFHAPYESSLELLSLPTYAWDVKDYWITSTETDNRTASAQNKLQTIPPELFLSTTAQYLVSKTQSPKVEVTFRAGISDHGFMGVIDGHKMQGTGLASGSVFSDAAATMAKYALEYSGRKNVTMAHLTFHDPELLAPLTRDIAGIDATLLSTATMATPSANSVLVTFRVTSAKGESHDLGSIRVEYRHNPEKAQADLDRVSFFIGSKMEERIRLSKQGSGHRIMPDVFFALFANAVKFSPDFRGVQEAYVSSDFQEAAASIVLRPDPVGTRFTFSPYWAEALLHLAGFMANGNPNKSPQTTYVVMGYESVEQLADIVPSKQYLTYTRISRWEKGTAFCDAYVLDPETSKIVMLAIDLRYQEFKTATWRHILDGHQHGAAAPPQVKKPTLEDTKGFEAVSAGSATAAPVEHPDVTHRADHEEASGRGDLKSILECLYKATGSDSAEFTDDTQLADIGVDSIMAIEVVAAVKDMGVDLPAAFIFEYPTIGDLRSAFGAPDTVTKEDDFSEVASSKGEASSLFTPGDDFNAVSAAESVSTSSSSLVEVGKESGDEADTDDDDDDDQDIDDGSPLPSVRITLLQGRPNASKTPLHLIADGTGTVASFIHLRPFKSKQAVYGIDSPYYNCPSRLTSKVGIRGVANLIVEALIKARGKGPFMIGGYSAGCLVAYEVSRQLAAEGCMVSGLLLIDMCCPRSRITDQRTLLAEDEFSYDVFQEAVSRDGLWSNIGARRDHFRAFFVAMNEYTPDAMAPFERPAKTAVIWAEKGLVNRVSDDPELMERLDRQGVPTKPYAGFMEDPKLGTFACLVPDKGENLGPNGWDRFTSGEVLAMSVADDHFELPMPGHVHLLQAQMEKAFTYFSS